MKLRALFGLWEGESTAFLGAVEYEVYDAMLEDDAAEGKDSWGDLCEQWKGQDWTRVTETREVDIHMPSSKLVHLFDTPTVPAMPVIGQEDD